MMLRFIGNGTLAQGFGPVAAIKVPLSPGATHLARPASKMRSTNFPSIKPTPLRLRGCLRGHFRKTLPPSVLADGYNRAMQQTVERTPGALRTRLGKTLHTAFARHRSGRPAVGDP